MKIFPYLIVICSILTSCQTNNGSVTKDNAQEVINYFFETKNYLYEKFDRAELSRIYMFYATEGRGLISFRESFGEHPDSISVYNPVNFLKTDEADNLRRLLVTYDQDGWKFKRMFEKYLYIMEATDGDADNPEIADFTSKAYELVNRLQDDKKAVTDFLQPFLIQAETLLFEDSDLYHYITDTREILTVMEKSLIDFRDEDNAIDKAQANIKALEVYISNSNNMTELSIDRNKARNYTDTVQEAQQYITILKAAIEEDGFNPVNHLKLENIILRTERNYRWLIS